MALKSVLVTGANRGIGLELIKQYVSSSAAPSHIFATCRDPTKATELQKIAAENSAVHVIKLDAENESDLPNLKQAISDQVQEAGLNLIINNAGMNIKDGNASNFLTQTRSNLLKHFEVNSVFPILVVKELFPLLQQAKAQSKDSAMSGHLAAVVNISSVMSSIEKNSGGYYAYRSSKTCLNMLTSCLSIELKNEGIISVLVHPGWVSTDMGGQRAPVTPQQSVSGIRDVIAKLSEKDCGLLYDYMGEKIPW